jgi:hypothetical protein
MSKATGLAHAKGVTEEIAQFVLPAFHADASMRMREEENDAVVA